MSGTLMDTTPLPPSAPGPSPPEAASAAMIPPAPVVTKSVQQESPLSPLFDVFAGPHGIYPGVRWLIYLIIGYVFFRLVGDLMHDLHPQSGGPIWWGMIAEGAMVFAAIVPGFMMARIEKRPFGEFGLPAHGAFRRNFWVGTLWGIASLSALMLVLRLAGAFEFGSLALHGASILKYAVYYAVFFLLTGFFEEFLFRGYSQWVLSKGIHFWPTAALLSVAFGLVHGGNPGEGKTGLVAAGLIGFFFSLTLRRTGNLWWAVGFHMSWDWGESYLYSVPDSGGTMPGHLLNSSFHGPVWLTGGSVGPEGSLLVFVVIVAMWVLFDQLHPEVKYRS
ncbi:MAG: CPBP family intramembrane metalloprotease [Acidobacteriales bacterium]|nr:CPBP family intramembrane metalloprotease [Candidatus Koribacter versatilis]MBI3644831.1 CPBP family intramembrane metalloprotease [Terriglobales bacterium]